MSFVGVVLFVFFLRFLDDVSPGIRPKLANVELITSSSRTRAASLLYFAPVAELIPPPRNDVANVARVSISLACRSSFEFKFRGARSAPRWFSNITLVGGAVG